MAHRKSKHHEKHTASFVPHSQEVFKAPSSENQRDLASGDSSKLSIGNDPFLPMLSPFWAWRFTSKI